MAIDGVRVLAQEVIKETPNFVFVVAGLIVGCMILFAILSLTIRKVWATDLAADVCIIGAFIGFLWMIIAGACGIFDRPSGRNTYKCIFDEGVSIQEVYDNYEVVGRDGEIWILEDKK